MFTKNKGTKKKKNEKLEVNYKLEGNKLIVDIDFSLYRHALHWKKAYVSLIYDTKVKLSRPKNVLKTIHLRDFIIDFHKKIIIFNLKDDEIYTFKWRNIDLNLKLLVRIDDAIFFDTKIIQKVKRELSNKNRGF